MYNIIKSIWGCFVSCIFILSACISISDKELYCIQLDPLEKVLQEQVYFIEKKDTIAVARGETASFQLVIRSPYAINNLKIDAGDLINGDQSIAVNLKAFVGYVPADRNTPNPSRDRLISASNIFPDPLLEVESMNVPPMTNQPVWVNYHVPRGIKEGVYTAEITLLGKVNGKEVKTKKQVYVKVYNVTLPEQTLWVTNWFGMDNNVLRQMNNNESVELYSERYWQLAKVFANKMRDYGQNVYIISPLRLCQYKISGLNYEFDFTHFDKMVELFIREGNLKRIEGTHVGGRLSHWSSPFGVWVPSIKDTETVFTITPLSNDTAKTFISQFIPALFEHLKMRKWDKMYMQHIADEPIRENAQSYIDIANEVKNFAPDVEIIEANHSREVQNTIKIWVPQLDFYHQDYSFYKERQEDGDEVWFYTCLAPQGNYANRFLEQPLILTRILHWINYRFGATGYLHWGLNAWRGYGPYDGTTWINTESGGILPAGDSWITYPGYGKLYGSIRFEAMRDGIADYELLKLLEEKYPDEAKELARTIVYGFDHYDINIKSFREKRVKILTLLSE